MSAETGHTPGPWKLERSAFGVVVPIIINDAGEYVGEAGNDPDKGYENAAKTEEQGLANARVMTAAPDLLEALKACVARLNAIDAARFVERDMAELALAKASGVGRRVVELREKHDGSDGLPAGDRVRFVFEGTNETAPSPFSKEAL